MEFEKKKRNHDVSITMELTHTYYKYTEKAKQRQFYSRFLYPKVNRNDFDMG